MVHSGIRYSIVYENDKALLKRRFGKLLLATFLGSTAAFAFTAIAQADPAPCTLAGSIATCQGDQSDGIASTIDFPSTATILNVNSLSGDIMPGTGIDGIFYEGDTSATLNASFGSNSIRMSGIGQGIKVQAPGAVSITTDADIYDAQIAVEGYSTGDDVFIDNSGNIVRAQNRGVSAYTENGTATVINNADVNARNKALFAFGDDGASVDSTGELTSSQGRGIDVQSNNGFASATSVGDIHAYLGGIQVIGDTGATINSTGDVTSLLDNGLHAQTFGTGTASVTSRGEIFARNIGIFAYGNSGAFVDSEGDITSLQNDAINLWTSMGNAEVRTTGDVTGYRGIISYRAGADDGGSNNVYSEGNYSTRATAIQTYISGEGTTTRVEHDGDINSTEGSGIVAQSWGGEIADQNETTIISNGNITVQNEGIAARTNYGDVMLTHTGNITSYDTKGIDAQAWSGGNVYVTVTGDVQARTEAIQAYSGGGIANTMTQIRSTGNVTAFDAFALNANNYADGGTAEIISRGDVWAKTLGIQAIAHSTNGTAIVDSVGDVMATDDFGILAMAQNDFGVAEITSEGTVKGGTQGMFAYGDTSATITQRGDVFGYDGNGIQVQAFGDPDGNAHTEVDFEGDIFSRGIGIMAYSGGSATINSTGNIIATDEDAINVYKSSANDGSVLVNSTGDLQSGGRGINVVNASSNANDMIEIYSTGEIISKADGILADSFNSVSYAEQTGNITSYEGRAAQIHGNQGATLISEGFFQAQDEGIDVRSQNGMASLTHTGDVSSIENRGIIVESAGGSATATTVGNVYAQDQGIQINSSNGLASLNHTGMVVSHESRGIEMNGYGTGPVSLILDGSVLGQKQAIQAISHGSGGVTVDVTGTVEAIEEYGIYTQSAGGTIDIDLVGSSQSLDRSGIFALNTAGSVDVDVSGGIVRSLGSAEAEADGIYVEGTGNNTVDIGADTLVYGGYDTPNNFGVQFSGGGTNTLTNWGTITDQLGGQTVGGDTGDDIVDNYGVVTGSFYLGGGSNAFNNMEGAWLNTGLFSSVGAGNALTNDGDMSVLGIGTLGESDFEGNFIQSATGNFHVDIDFGNGDADLLDIQPGGTATVDGLVTANLTNLGTTTTPWDVTIINAPGGVTDNGIVGNNSGPLMVTVTTDADEVFAEVGVDLGAGGGLGGLQGFGDALQNSFENEVPGGLTDEEEWFFLSLINSGEGYEDALGSASPIGQGAVTASTFFGATAFVDSLYSCRQIGGAYRFTAEGDCVWARGQGRTQDYDPSGTVNDYDTDAFSVAGGIQRSYNDVWTFGFAGGYEDGETNSFNTTLDYDRFDLGAVAKGQWGAYMLAGSVSGGWGTVDSSRSVLIPAPATAKGSRDTSHFDATIRGSHVSEMGSGYLKLTLEGGATYISADGFNESGAGIANLSVSSTSEWFGRGSAMAELGGEYALGGGSLLRPYLSAGVTALSTDSVDVTASLPGLNTGNFTVTSDIDQVYGVVRAGADLLNPSGWNVRLEYGGRVSSNSVEHSGLLKGSVAF